MKFITLTLCLISLTCLSWSNALASPQKTENPDFAAIDTYIESQMQLLRIPGLALGIVQRDQIIYLKGYGIADPSGRAVTPQTPFVIGSTTKSFTALAVMQLVDAGKIDLDAPLQQYLPWFHVTDIDASSHITVRQLLNQTSGISTSDGNTDFVREENADDALERRAHGLQTVPLTQPSGVTFQYANANYDLLGLLVQVASGQSYEEYIRQHIFAPLEMHHSHTTPSSAREDGLATGYHYWFGVPVAMKTPFPRGSLPSGYLMASVEDMSHYLIAQLSEGRYGEETLLSEQGMVTLHHPQVAAFDGNQYAMGWFVDQNGDGTTMWHNGTVPGFNAKVMLLPEDGWGVVVLMNASSQLNEARKEAIVDGVIHLMRGHALQPVPVNNQVVVLYAVILFIAAIPLVSLVWSSLALRRWQLNPARRPHGWRLAVRVVSLCGLNLMIALLFLIVQPRLFGIGLRGTLLLSPDIGSIMLVGCLIALVWCVVYPLKLVR